MSGIPDRAAVVGAGIGGLTAALCLARAGAAVTVFERAPALGEVGAGLQLSPNAMQVMGVLDLDTRLIAGGFEPEFATLRHWQTGFRTLTVPLGDAMRRRHGAPYLHIHRADLHAALAEGARDAGVKLRLGQPIDGYEIVRDRVRAAGEDFGLLVGADGVHSAIRAKLVRPDPPRFAGHVAWRGTVPAQALTRPLPADATVWAGPGAHIVTYYLRGGTLANFVAVEERGDWTEESWTTTRDAGELRRRFAGWHPSATQFFAELDKAALWGLFDRPELARWHDGPVALLGDACHPTLPFMAQGAALAIEDAWILTRAVERHGVLAGLAAYECARKARATRLQAKARSNGAFFHLSEGPMGLFSLLKFAGSALIPPDLAMRMFDEIFSYNPIVEGERL